MLPKSVFNTGGLMWDNERTKIGNGDQTEQSD